LGEALTAVRAIEHEYSRAEALRSLAPHLQAELLGEALTTAREIEHEFSRAKALSSLAPHLPAEQRQTVLHEALTAVRAIADEYYRAEALHGLAPHLPEQRQSLLCEALTVARKIEDKDEYDSRVQVLSSLAHSLATWVNQRDSLAYRTWVETLPLLAVRPRPQFLRDLTALMPFLFALADDEAAPAAAGIYHAIQEVCGWWP
jgi:hypothetical protein